MTATLPTSHPATSPPDLPLHVAKAVWPVLQRAMRYTPHIAMLCVETFGGLTGPNQGDTGIRYTVTCGHMLVQVEVAEEHPHGVWYVSAAGVKEFISSKGHAPVDYNESAEFPDYRQVMPNPTGRPVAVLGVNLDYLAVGSKVLKALKVGHGPAMRLTLDGSMGPLLLESLCPQSAATGDIARVSIVVMPMRLD